MRTSNIILLGAFIATILIITSIHVVIYAKIKNRDLISLRQHSEDRERIVLGNIKHVSITGLEECRILPGNTAAIDVDREWLKNFQYRVAGDSLIIDGGLHENEYQVGNKKYAPIELYLPPVESITAHFSNIFLRGAEDSANAVSRSILINNSHLDVTAGMREPKPAYWKNLRVNALHSGAVLAPGTVVHEFSINLNANSSFTDGGADLQNFSVQVDSTSTVSLRKKSLSNLKLVK